MEITSHLDTTRPQLLKSHKTGSYGEIYIAKPLRQHPLNEEKLLFRILDTRKLDYQHHKLAPYAIQYLVSHSTKILSLYDIHFQKNACGDFKPEFQYGLLC
jgi:hypothetical protein